MTGPVTTAAILLRPAIPLWIALPVALAFAVAAWTTYRQCSLERRQRIGLWSLRMAALAILLWLLCQPESRRILRRQDPPTLAFAVDVSASMTERLPGVVVGRDEKTVEFLSDSRVRRLNKRYRFVMFEIGTDVRETDTPPERLVFNAPRSNIVAGLNRIADKLRGSNPAAVILLSDGLDQSGEDLSPAARRIPIFIPELERPLPEKKVEEKKLDAWIAEVSYPKMTVVDWKAAIDVLVRRRGDAPVSFPIHLYQDQRRIRSSVVQFGPNEHYRQVTFDIEPMQTGRIPYRVEIQPQNDADAENNVREFLIDVTSSKNRVIYLEGTPRWEFKFLKRALVSDKTYQLEAYVQAGEGNFISFSESEGAARASSPDLTDDGLRAYRVIILGDLPASAFNEQTAGAIQNFVDRGGGALLVGAAKAYGEKGWKTVPYLQELLPATPEKGSRMREGRFSVDLTPQGRAHPALRAFQAEAALPPILSVWSPVRVNPLSTVLIGTLDGAPVVVTRRYGQGRVAMILSDTLWKWQLGSAGGIGEKTLYAKFITQLIYWLAPQAKEVEKTGMLQAFTAKTEVEPRERVVIGAVWTGEQKGNEPPACTVTTPDKRRLPFPMTPAVLGQDVGLTRETQGFKCVFSPDKPGRYEITVSASDGTQSARLLLLVTKPEREKTGKPINRDLLKRLAKESGGEFVAWKNRYRFLKKIPYQPREIRQIIERPIWNRFVWLLLLIVLFSAEWYWRRRIDLV